MFLWPLSMGAPVFDPSTGERASGALAYFYAGGTTTPLPVYTTDDGTVPLTNPVIADAGGVFPPIFIPYVSYGFRLTDASGATIGTPIATVQNPAPPASGGGGGVVVTSDQLLQTGDPIWRLRNGTMAGFVRMNDQTIGGAGSGATERANADTVNLFKFLWDNCSNAIAPVSGGRGANGQADFDANRTIVVPTMAGFIAGGLDDSGANAANRIQVSTTISTTNGNTAATVASSVGLFIGMKVVSANVQAGTTITGITGTSITLSLAASATASGTAARFSMFTDAQLVGAMGGLKSATLFQSQVPTLGVSGTAANAGTLSGQTITLKNFGVQLGSGATAYGAGAGNDATIPVSVSDATRSISAAFSNGDQREYSLIQPTRLGTFFMKL